MSTRTGAEIVAETLKKAGVRQVFGIVSIHNMPIVDAIGRLDGIEMVTVRNEQSATHMADGYARASGGLGVSLGSTGPGTTNTVTLAWTARGSNSTKWKTSSRRLAISFQADCSATFLAAVGEAVAAGSDAAKTCAVTQRSTWKMPRAVLPRPLD